MPSVPPAVENIVNHQHVSAGDFTQVVRQHLRSLGAYALAGITADNQQADLHGEGDLPDEISTEDHRAGHDRDDGDLREIILADAVIGGDLCRQFAHPAGDLIVGNENAFDVFVHDGSDLPNGDAARFQTFRADYEPRPGGNGDCNRLILIVQRDLVRSTLQNMHAIRQRLAA
jgi:hypothetical protein